MDKHEVARGLAVIMDEVRRELAIHGMEAFCIHGSALLTRVLHQMGFPDAHLLTVGVQIHNEAVQQWVGSHGGFPQDESSVKALDDAGGASILIGKGSEGMVSDDHWPGHLVVIVPKAFGDKHALLDPTIVQAHKPELNIQLQPLVLQVSELFTSGKETFKADVRGTLAIYEAFPKDHSYNDNGDCMELEGIDIATSEVLRRLTK